jgi:hypothetical protein
VWSTHCDDARLNPERLHSASVGAQNESHLSLWRPSKGMGASAVFLEDR